jgi:sugar phosphate isomerase/epimerase
VFLKQRLNGSHLDLLASAGAQAIEIFCSRRHFEYTSRAHVREIADWFQNNAVRPWSIHAPIYADGDNGRGDAPTVNVIHVEKSRRIDAMDEIKRALEAAEQIPFGHMILHLGERNNDWSPRALEHAMTAIEHLRAFARPLGVQILVENLEKNEVAQPEHLLEILAAGHFNDIGVCLDVGHAHLDSGIAPAIAVLGDRIRSTHIHDNAGDRDSHLWPGDGTIAWAEAMPLLARLPQPPATVLEISYREEVSGDRPAEKFRCAFDTIETPAEPAAT